MVAGVDILILNSNVLNLLKRDLRKLGRDFASTNKLREPFEDIRDEVMIPSIEKNFEVGGRPRWEPLSLVTVGGGRAASGDIGGRKPLTKTGQMRKAATAKARFQVRKNEMTYGKWPEKRWFGTVHNLPDLSVKAQIPNRPFTLIQSEDKEAIKEIMMDWIEKKVRQRIRLRYV